MGFFTQYRITPRELDDVIASNPSLRGFILGYIAEFKLRKKFEADKQFVDVVKYDNHDRTRKGDLNFYYKNLECSIEVKSIQTNSIRKENNILKGVFQCDASDKRKVKLPNGKSVETTCLVVGEFDLVAVPLFPFARKWIYAYAKNSDLPRTTSTKYSKTVSKYLLATSVPITWPLKPPFYLDPIPLLNQVVRERGQKSTHKTLTR